MRSTPAELPQIEGVDERSREHLAVALRAVRRAGAEASAPSARSSREPIVPGMPDLLVEAMVAARYEQARGVADVLLRRTRLGLLAARRLADDRDARAPGGRRDGAGARLGPAPQSKREAEAWLEAAAAEGLVPVESERPLEATAG